MASKKGMSFSLPILGKVKLNQQQTYLAGAAALGIIGLGFLAYTGKTTGVPFVDTSAQRFGELATEYTGFNFPGAPAPVAPMEAPPVAVAEPPLSPQGVEELPLSGSYAVDAPLPYSDWWNNDIDEDDRIVVA